MLDNEENNIILRLTEINERVLVYIKYYQTTCNFVSNHK